MQNTIAAPEDNILGLLDQARKIIKKQSERERQLASLLEGVRGTLHGIMHQTGIERYASAKEIAEATGLKSSKVRAMLRHLPSPKASARKYPFIEGIAYIRAMEASEPEMREVFALNVLVDTIREVSEKSPRRIGDRLYTIGRIAKQTGIPVDRVKGYYEAGMISAVKTVQGYPRFERKSVNEIVRLFQQDMHPQQQGDH